MTGLIPPLSLLRRAQFHTAHWIWSIILAGFLGGIASGLKPVACIFAPGAALGLALTVGGARRFFITAFVFGVAWIIGFACAYGPWGLTVARIFDSPIFPLMNHIFASPWIPSISYLDQRFLPQDVWRTLFYPFFWLSGRPSVVAEIGVRDPRFALTWLSLAVILFHAIRARSFDRPIIALAIFFVLSFITWEAMFSILRYALTLEVMTGILMARALMILCDGTPEDIRSERRLIVLCGVVLVAVFAVSSRPGWGRLRSHGATVFDIQAPPMPDHAVVVFVAKPMAFVAPFLKGIDLTFVGINDVPIPSRLSQEITRRIQSRPSVMAVVPDKFDIDDALTSKFGFRILRQRCQPIISANQRDLRICPCELIKAAI